MYKNLFKRSIILALGLTIFSGCLAGCTKEKVYDDVATNNGYVVTTETAGKPDTKQDYNTQSNRDDALTTSTTESVTSNIHEDFTHTNHGADDASSDTHNTTSDGNTSQPVGDAIPKNDIKIGIIYQTTPTEYIGNTYIHDLGIQGMQSTLKLSDEQIIRKIYIDDSNPAATRKAIQECIDEGCHIIFTTSEGYAETTSAMAKEHPDIYFANCNGNLSNGSNFTNYAGRIYQAGYLSGIAAGMKTQSDKIGYVSTADINDSKVTGNINAFALGVYSVNPDAQIYVRVTNSRISSQREEQCARDLIFAGCDVLAQNCDTTKPQYIASLNGFWGIGYNSDMEQKIKNVTLCSVIWNWGSYYTSVVQDVINGTWNGDSYYGGISEGLVNITNLAENLNDTETITLVENAKNKITDGTLPIFEGVIETNTGATIGTDGKAFDDHTIANDMHWYFKNVLVLHNDGSFTDGTELLSVTE